MRMMYERAVVTAPHFHSNWENISTGHITAAEEALQSERRQEPIASAVSVEATSR